MANKKSEYTPLSMMWFHGSKKPFNGIKTGRKTIFSHPRQEKFVHSNQKNIYKLIKHSIRLTLIKYDNVNYINDKIDRR